jgi:hypothetical protein
MKVHERLGLVQRDMSAMGIAKDSKNKQQGYAYRGIDDVMNTLAPLLAEHGLLIMPSVMESKFDTVATKQGGSAYHWWVNVSYTIIGQEGDSMGPFLSHGECVDSSDKGLNKACSAAFKYWVLTALCVPTEASEDADEVTEPAAPATITAENQKDLHSLLMNLSEENSAKFWTWLNGKGVDHLNEIPIGAFVVIRAAANKIYSEQYAEEQAQTALALQAGAAQ